MKDYKVKDIADLKKLTEEGKDCFISLNGGIRSSKRITYDGKFDIYNESDGSMQRLTEKQLFNEDKTNIGKALNLGALFIHGYERVKA